MTHHRPIYETEADLVNERSVAEFIGQEWKCEARKLPRFYPADLALMRGGNLSAWVEVKCRKNASSAYPSYFLSVHKVNQLVMLQITSGRPAFLVVRFTDTILYHRVHPPYELIDWVKRTAKNDRGDSQDEEPAVAIPMTDFKPVELRKS